MTEKNTKSRMRLFLRIGFCATVMALMFLVGVVMASAEVYTGTCGADGDNLAWSLDTDTGVLTVSGEGNMKNYSTLGKSPWYKYYTQIKTVVIEEGVTSVGNYAFSGWQGSYRYTSVWIPDSVTNVGKQAFYENKSLKEARVSGKIGEYAFSYCTNLEKVVFSEHTTWIHAFAFANDKKITEVVFENTNGWIYDGNNNTTTGVAYTNFSDSIATGKWLEQARYKKCIATEFTITFIADQIIDSVSYQNINHDIAFPTCPDKKHYVGAWEDFDLTDGGNLTVNAIYIPIEYTITFMLNGEVVGVETYTVESTSVNEPVIPAKEGYVGAWDNYDLKNGGNITVNGTYVPVPYTVTFVANGVTVDTATYTVGNLTVEAPEVPAKTHYTGAWETYDLSNGGDVTVNAVYTPVTYTVTFVADGVTVDTATYTVEDLTVEAPEVPAKTHYTGAWETYDLSNGGDVTVNTVYTPVTYTVTFVANGVTVDTATYTVEKLTVEAPEVPAKTHYAGAWETYDLSNGGDVTVNAVYTPVTYTVTFVADGVTVDTATYTVENLTVEAPEVPTKTHYTGVWETYDLSLGGDLTVHAVYVVSVSKLTSASLTLGQSLALNYYATLNPAHTAAVMRFTYHGETVTVDGILDETTGEYKFTLARISPQCMADEIKAELILIVEDGTETLLDIKESYSVRQYCDDALAANPDNETLATLLADLLAYGDASQNYANYKEDAPVSDGFEVAPSGWQDVTDTDLTLTDPTREDIRFTAAGVRFAYINRIYFKIKSADLAGVTVTVNGKTYTAEELSFVENADGTYILYTDGIYATEFDKVFTAKLAVDGETVQTATYSVKSYVYAMQNSENTEMAALAKALYNYGCSAIAYVNAQ